MNNVINEQLNLVLEELELITDTYQRADIRVKLISALMGTSVEDLDEPTGKEAFKNDKKKETVEKQPAKEDKKKSNKKEDKSKKKIEVSEDAPIIFEPADDFTSEDAVTETPEKDPEPKEVNLESNEEVNEPIVIECEDDNGKAYTLDITDAWNVVGDEEGSEEAVELAKNLTEYNLLPVYNTFEKLDNCYNKMMLAYYMQEFGLQGINEFIDSLTEGVFKDVYEFVNNENLEGLIANIEEAAQEE